MIICITSFINRKNNSSNKETKNNNNNIEAKIAKLKYLTNDNKTLYEGAQKCIEKDPDEQLCLYQFICPKEVISKKKEF